MELIRRNSEQLGWEHGPLHIALVDGAIHLVSRHTDQPFNFMVTPACAELLAGTPQQLMQALVALTLENPPSTLADVATNPGALFAGSPVRSADSA